MSRKTEVLTIRLNEDLKNEIKQEAGSLGLSSSQYILLLYSKYKDDFNKNLGKL